MSEFQRSPSKVWWGNDYPDSIHYNPQWKSPVQKIDTPVQPKSQQKSQENIDKSPVPNQNGSRISNKSQAPGWLSRTSSGSPSSHRSQDSGFSDSETSPVLQNMKKEEREENNNTINKYPVNTESNLLKESSNETPNKNFKGTLKEKCTAKKILTSHLNDRIINKSLNFISNKTSNDFPKSRSLPTTPIHHGLEKDFIYKNGQQFNVTLYKEIQANQLIHRKSPIQIHPNVPCNERRSVHQLSPNKNQITLQSPLENHKIYERIRPPQNDVNASSQNDCNSRNSPSRQSPKVNRNLLNSFTNSECSSLPVNDDELVTEFNKHFSNTRITNRSSYRNIKDNVVNIRQQNQTLSKTVPLFNPHKGPQHRLNVTAPAGKELQYNPDEISFEEATTPNTTGDYLNSNSSLPCTPSRTLDSDEKYSSQAFLQNIEHFEPPACSTSTPKTSKFGGPGKSARKELFEKGICRLRNHRIKSDSETSKAISNPKDCDSPPVQKWIEDLATLYETECMVTLQSKSLAAELSRQVAEAAAVATKTIKSLLSHSRIIYADFATIYKQLMSKSTTHIGPLLQSLTGNITEFILTYSISTQSGGVVTTNQREQLVHNILDLCDSLRQLISQKIDTCEFLTKDVMRLRNLFKELDVTIIMYQTELLVNMVEDPSSELAIRGAIQGITWLATQAQQHKELNLINCLIKCSAPRSLLAICVESRASTLRANALRAIATVCCTSAAIRQLEQSGGVEVLSDILSEESRPEPELSEAAAVVAQITAPWIEDNHSIKGLKQFVMSLVQSLTRLAETTQCCNVILLCSAALANISSMESTAVWCLLKYQTVEKLLNAIQKRGPGVSVFIKEQTATLIANMATVDETRIQLTEGKAATGLLCFLQVQLVTTSETTSSELAAAQRLQQKSAIALSRLCTEKSFAMQIVNLGGVLQLVRLCKQKRERNHSDAVLVACLATLRKIANHCGSNVMNEEDAMELIEPNLLDSFLTLTTQNESYV